MQGDLVPDPIVKGSPSFGTWSFLAIVAVGVVWTVASHLARLPTGARGYYSRGVADTRAGRFESAIANLDRAIALDPTKANARVARANAWYRAGRPYLALVDADAALALEPASSRALYVRGCVLRRIGRDDEALASFDDAIKADPSFGPAVLARGDTLFDRASFGEALQTYRRAYALRRTDDTLYFTPVLIWASRLMTEDAAGADAEMRDSVQASLADRLRRGSWVADNEDAAVSLWIEAIKDLGAGERARAIEKLRRVAVASPPDSWTRERARSMLATLTVGFCVQPDNNEISPSFSFGPGVTIASVRDGGSAADAGLAAGDRLLRVDGVDATPELVDGLVARAAVGSALRVDVSRRGEPFTATIVVGTLPALRPGASAPTR